MKRIGILTHYYNSINYGGNLQAYALCVKLKKMGYVPEQIKLPCTFIALPSVDEKFVQKLKRYIKSGGIYTLKAIFRRVFSPINRRKGRNIVNCQYDRRYQNAVEMRKKAFEEFNGSIIPHSRREYSLESIQESMNDYDCFITGSDQVWNLNCYNPAFFLDFVTDDKVKISYAASLAMEQLNDNQQEVFREKLKDFNAVSVREENAINLIRDLSPVKPVLVADPTLLLTEKEWDDVCESRVIEQEYMFCYFLGDNRIERDLAKEYARAKGLVLVNIPYMNRYNDIDAEEFGDLNLCDVSPQKFLSLIKFAKCVFTDSFHAVVFSHIYKKNYIVFKRTEHDMMCSRIKNIVELFQTSDRFCNSSTRQNMHYICNLPEINYNRKLENLEKLKSISVEYLRKNLGV